MEARDFSTELEDNLEKLFRRDGFLIRRVVVALPLFSGWVGAVKATGWPLPSPPDVP
ncbi:hypothetical protein BDZ45DRAFT_678403 [Acephala macrosclerotiorum]|nr:hypothetical protein BDZ45DRAFT_678403 [Acephala macrosclerotiorum]